MFQRSDDGFSFVEVLIAMFLLALASIALLPLLIQGVALSVRQSATATATRQVSALIDEVRANPTCPTIAGVTGTRTVQDGGGRTLTIVGTATTCAANTTVTVAFVATDPVGAMLSQTQGLVYVP